MLDAGARGRRRHRPRADRARRGRHHRPPAGSRARRLRPPRRRGQARLPPRRDLRPRGAARGRPAGERRRHRQRPRLLPGGRGPRASRLRLDRLRRRQANRRGLRARAGDGPGVQEPLRVDQVPGRGLGARAELDRVPTTILRPAIVVGDSATGETEKFDGPYYILRALSRSQRMGQPMPQFGRSGAAFNVVPVDYVVAAMVAAAGDPRDARRDPAPGRSRPAQRARAGRAALESLHRPRHPRPDPGRDGRALPAAQARARGVRRHPRASRSPTSTTRWSTTPGAPSTCSRRTASSRRAFPSTRRRSSASIARARTTPRCGRSRPPERGLRRRRAPRSRRRPSASSSAISSVPDPSRLHPLVRHHLLVDLVAVRRATRR